MHRISLFTALIVFVLTASIQVAGRAESGLGNTGPEGLAPVKITNNLASYEAEKSLSDDKIRLAGHYTHISTGYGHGDACGCGQLWSDYSQSSCCGSSLWSRFRGSGCGGSDCWGSHYDDGCSSCGSVWGKISSWKAGLTKWIPRMSYRSSHGHCCDTGCEPGCLDGLLGGWRPFKCLLARLKHCCRPGCDSDDCGCSSAWQHNYDTLLGAGQGFSDIETYMQPEATYPAQPENLEIPHPADPQPQLQAPLESGEIPPPPRENQSARQWFSAQSGQIANTARDNWLCRPIR